MDMMDVTRRGLVRLLAVAPLFALGRPPEAAAQAGSPVPVRVDTKGLVARIKFESVLEGYLTELNGRYKLRVTELTLEPGGHVGEHNHVGPGIRMMTFGEMTYVLPDKTLITAPATSSSSRATSTTPCSTGATSPTSTCSSRSCRPTSRAPRSCP
jgi:hypothetical protein